MGSSCEKAEQFLTKGKLVYIEGRLKTRVIEKEGGEKIYKTEIVVGNMIFLSKKGEFEDGTSDDTDFSDEVDNDDMF